MNEPEAFQLLTLASARDNRTASESVAKIWAIDLERVALEDAVDALTLHYREKPDVWLQPGHVIAGARRVRAQRERDERISAPRAIEQKITLPPREEFERMTREAIEQYRAKETR